MGRSDVDVFGVMGRSGVDMFDDIGFYGVDVFDVMASYNVDVLDALGFVCCLTSANVFLLKMSDKDSKDSSVLGTSVQVPANVKKY